MLFSRQRDTAGVRGGVPRRGHAETRLGPVSREPIDHSAVLRTARHALPNRSSKNSMTSYAGRLSQDRAKPRISLNGTVVVCVTGGVEPVRHVSTWWTRQCAKYRSGAIGWGGVGSGRGARSRPRSRSSVPEPCFCSPPCPARPRRQPLSVEAQIRTECPVPVAHPGIGSRPAPNRGLRRASHSVTEAVTRASTALPRLRASAQSSACSRVVVLDQHGRWRRGQPDW